MKKNLSVLIEPRLPGIVITFIGAALLWIIAAFFATNEGVWTIHNSPLSAWLNNHFTSNPLLLRLLGFLCALIMGALLVQINKYYAFIKTRSLLPFFFFMLLVGSNVSTQYFNFSLVSCLFLLITLWQLFSLYEKKQAVFTTFNIGFCSALGSFFAIELVLFAPLLIFGIYRFKGLTLRTFLAFLMGLLTPFVLIIGIIYLLNENVLSYISLFLSEFSFCLTQNLDSKTIFYLITLGITGIVAVLNIINNPFNDKIKVSRMLGFIIIGFVFFGLLFLFRSNNLSLIFMMEGIFMTTLFAHYFSLNKGIFTFSLFWVQTIISLLYFLSTILAIPLF